MGWRQQEMGKKRDRYRGYRVLGTPWLMARVGGDKVRAKPSVLAFLEAPSQQSHPCLPLSHFCFYDIPTMAVGWVSKQRVGDQEALPGLQLLCLPVQWPAQKSSLDTLPVTS